MTTQTLRTPAPPTRAGTGALPPAARHAPRLLVPGLRDSGPAHWQSQWQRALPGIHRLHHDDWDTPDLERWGAAVARAIDALRVPPIVIAHSFGCLATLHAIGYFRRPVAGVLLVAPADPERFALAQRLHCTPLPYPVTLVASSNDPWLRLTRAGHLANRLRARFVAYAGAGHINTEAGFGPWPEGRVLLRALERDARHHAHVPTAAAA